MKAPFSRPGDLPGLYIHVPFCLSKCPYCHFSSLSPFRPEDVEAYLTALFREMDLYRSFSSCFDTVYIGGGTPSVLTVSQMERLVDGVRRSFVIDPSAEWTLEANPGDGDVTLLRTCRELGINRINVGVQSFDDGTLAFLGRRHTAREAAGALEACRRAGFANLGVDLIYGVPGQTEDAWMETLRKALAFSPEHLSCYELTIEPGTPFHDLRWRGELLPFTEDRSFRFFMETSEYLEKKGYEHYEVSNFARTPRFRSRHNGKYWNHTPYLGLGPSAHSFLDGTRWWNRESLADYVLALGQGKKPVAAAERLSEEELRLEALFLGFRTRDGIHLAEFKTFYGVDLLSEKADIISNLVHEGILRREGAFLRPTRKGLAVADRLALI